MKSSLVFLSGIAIGTVLGVLIAPTSGRVTIRRIKMEADRMVDKLVQKEQLEEHVRHEQGVAARHRV